MKATFLVGGKGLLFRMGEKMKRLSRDMLLLLLLLGKIWEFDVVVGRRLEELWHTTSCCCVGGGGCGGGGGGVGRGVL
jgi:hypothetical protein